MMHLDNEPFRLISDGNKTIEIRLNDEKRQRLDKGDIIEFVNRKTGEKLLTEVVDLFRRASFEELIDAYPLYDFGSNNKAELLNSLRKFYSNEAIAKYGVLGIKIKILKVGKYCKMDSIMIMFIHKKETRYDR